MPALWSRRKFLRKFASVNALTALSGGGALAYGNQVERRWLWVERQEVALPHLPAVMDGFRIAQISDLHLEPWTKAGEIEETVAACNALKPDLVAITGDMTTSPSAAPGLLGEILSKLEAPCGVYAILGNHDMWGGGTPVAKPLMDKGIKVLRSRREIVHCDKGSFHIAGFDSFWRGHPNLKQALDGWRRGQPLVLLVHEPDAVDHLAASGVTGLQLSGHTHGGQVRLPLPLPAAIHLPRMGRKYVAGHYQVGAMQVYVNRGIGCTGVPVRFACPPEVTEITLRSTAAMA